MTRYYMEDDFERETIEEKEKREFEKKIADSIHIEVDKENGAISAKAMVPIKEKLSDDCQITISRESSGYFDKQDALECKPPLRYIVIKVNGCDESRAIQQLLFDNGFKWGSGSINIIRTVENITLVTGDERFYLISGIGGSLYKNKVYQAKKILKTYNRLCNNCGGCIAKKDNIKDGS